MIEDIGFEGKIYFDTKYMNEWTKDTQVEEE